MTPEGFIEIFQSALYVVLLLVSVIIVPGLVVGLIVAVFQAATSINEQTLSFLPRLIVTLLMLIFMSHWILRVLMEYFFELIEQIPNLVF